MQKADSQYKNFPGQNRWDSVNSTYKHEIHLENGKKLVGYSKGLLQPEMQDKTVLLERVILRLVKSGYLNVGRVVKIEFFLKSFLESSSELILVLYPGEYTLGNNETIITDQRLLTFITRLYAQLDTKTIVTKSLSHKPVNVPEETLYSLQYKRFKTFPELHVFVQKQIQRGDPKGLVMDFYYKYSQKYLVGGL